MEFATGVTHDASRGILFVDSPSRISAARLTAAVAVGAGANADSIEKGHGTLSVPTRASAATASAARGVQARAGEHGGL